MNRKILISIVLVVAACALVRAEVKRAPQVRNTPQVRKLVVTVLTKADMGVTPLRNFQAVALVKGLCPSGGAGVTGLPVTLTWDRVASAKTYEITVWPAVVMSTGPKTSESYLKIVPSVAGTYTWKVRAISGTGKVLGSAEASFDWVPMIHHLPKTAAPDIEILKNSAGKRSWKIEQLIGDVDFETGQPTRNLTDSRFGLAATDLGVPFRHKDRTYVLFGDSTSARDPIGYTQDTNGDDGVDLNFIPKLDGDWKPVTVPGVSLDGFEVPMEGTSVGGKMYIYCTTDHSPQRVMGRSILACSLDDGKTFEYLYDLSTLHFLNVSLVEVDAAKWPGLPMATGTSHVMFGTGEYRKSKIRLGFQPAGQIESRESVRYLAGFDTNNRPLWSSQETDATPLFDQSYIGELSVTYNAYLQKWLLTYNNFVTPRGINVRTADSPWGPWSWTQVLFDPWADGGYRVFMHAAQNPDDGLAFPAWRKNEWGGEYGPYQFETLTKKEGNGVAIFFTMSTWNPYTVVLMKARLRVK